MITTPYSIVYVPEVEKDVLDAKEWYENQAKGLGKRFSSDVRKAIESLAKNPESFQLKYKTIRVKYTSVFPFGIHYDLDKEAKTITVLGVFHTSRNPKSWKSRKSK